MYTCTGHTHIKVFNKINGKYYINPGAVGCPEDTKFAPYGILEITKDNIEYNQYYEEYDTTRMKNAIIEAKYPGYYWILRLFYGIDDKKYLK